MYMKVLSHVFGLDRFDQRIEVAFFAASDLKDAFEILDGTSLHEHLVSFSELFVRKLQQFDDILWFAESLVNNADMTR